MYIHRQTTTNTATPQCDKIFITRKPASRGFAHSFSMFLIWAISTSDVIFLTYMGWCTVSLPSTPAHRVITDGPETSFLVAADTSCYIHCTTPLISCLSFLIASMSSQWVFAWYRYRTARSHYWVCSLPWKKSTARRLCAKGREIFE